MREVVRSCCREGGHEGGHEGGRRSTRQCFSRVGQSVGPYAARFEIWLASTMSYRTTADTRAWRESPPERAHRTETPHTRVFSYQAVKSRSQPLRGCPLSLRGRGGVACHTCTPRSVSAPGPAKLMVALGTSCAVVHVGSRLCSSAAKRTPALTSTMTCCRQDTRQS